MAELFEAGEARLRDGVSIDGDTDAGPPEPPVNPDHVEIDGVSRLDIMKAALRNMQNAAAVDTLGAQRVEQRLEHRQVGLVSAGRLRGNSCVNQPTQQSARRREGLLVDVRGDAKV